MSKRRLGLLVGMLMGMLVATSAAQEGLVAAWDFNDQAPGGVTADVSGRAPAAPATVYEDLPGLPAIVWDSERASWVLEPVYGYASAPFVDKMGFDTSFTMQVWVRPIDRNGNGLDDDVNQQWQSLVGANNGWGPRMATMNSSFVGMCQFWYDDNGWQVDGWNPINVWRGNSWNPASASYDGTGPWHHLLMTWDHLNHKFYGYVDGAQIAEIDRFGDWIVDWGDPFNMGRAGTSGTSWLIDDVAYWNGYCSPEVAAGLADGTYTMHTAPIPPAQAIWVGPYDGGLETNGWKLLWEDGSGGPYDSYDVYLGTNYQDVLSADAAAGVCTGPGVWPGDYTGDCRCDWNDLDVVVSNWLTPYGLTDFATLVANWDTGNPFKGNTTSKAYAHSNLEVGQTYYWRIDERQGGDTVKGNVWSFDVVAPWQLTEFVRFIGWPGLEQHSGAALTAYAQSLANMGINCVMDGPQTLDACHAVGIKVMIYKNPTSASYASTYKDHPGTWGYFQSDEPSQSEIPYWAQYHVDCHYADPTHPSYTNIQSINYGVSRSYVDYFIQTVRPEILSFDFYHWYWHTFWNGYPTLVENLDFYREKALQENIPLVSWVEVDAANSGGAENRSRHRYSVYLNLVYGVKGIMWFTASEVFNTATGAIINQGYYNDVQAMNAELANIGPYLVGLTSTAVYHTGIGSEDGDDAAYMDAIPGGHWVQVPTGGVALGMFVDGGGQDYAMVMNRDKDNAKTVTVQFTQPVSAVYLLNEQTGAWTTLTVTGSAPNQQVSLPVGGGYGKLLSIVRP